MREEMRLTLYVHRTELIFRIVHSHSTRVLWCRRMYVRESLLALCLEADALTLSFQELLNTHKAIKDVGFLQVKGVAVEVYTQIRTVDSYWGQSVECCSLGYLCSLVSLQS